MSTKPFKIDPSKVNLLERDIEDWLFDNPSAIGHAWDEVECWIGRQYKLPSGIADLVGVSKSGGLVVVEIKNAEINKAAVLQVCRYASDLAEIVSHRMNCARIYPGHDWSEPVVWKILVGPSIDAYTFTEAVSCGITVFAFTPVVYFSMSQLNWTNEYRETRSELIERISFGPEWDRFGQHIQDHIREHQGQQALAHELDEELGMILDSADDHDLSNS